MMKLSCVVGFNDCLKLFLQGRFKDWLQDRVKGKDTSTPSIKGRLALRGWLRQSKRVLPCLLVLKLILCSLALSNFTFSNFAHSAPPKPISFHVTEFKLIGTTPLSTKETTIILKPFANKDYTLSELQKATNSIEQAIRQKGFAFYRVILPPQSLAEGKVSLEVISFSLGQINIRGNEHFEGDNISAALPGFTPGESPNTKILAAQLKIANRHPSKQLNLTFKQSSDADLIDANLDVQDQKPLKLSLITNNSGTDQTGKSRVTTAAQYTNLWNRDHIVNASYTTSPGHVSDVTQLGLSYVAPFYPLNAWLTSYYAYSNVDSGVVANDFTVSGSGRIYGFHYLQYLPRIQSYEHWLDVGIDNRLFDNDIRFLKTPIGVDVRSVPYSLLYRGEYALNSTRLDFNIQWVQNTSLDNKNSDSEYANTRFGADNNWNLIRYGFSIKSSIATNWVLSAELTSQYSDEPLISGEQLGIGGSSSVRGYEERETGADRGEILNLELYFPKWNKATFLVFADYGHGHMAKAQPGEKANWDISSVGVGTRWQWRNKLFLNLDWAVALADGPETDDTDNHIHATLALSL